jgi:cysteine desulfuration protein SufE
MSLPDNLQKIVDRFASAPRELKGQALLRYANQVPDLPPRFAEDRDRLAQVHECQTPFFLATELDAEGGVHFHFDCPPEAPTVRGYAGILLEGLEGENHSVVLEVPTNFYTAMGLEEVVSPMRLRGMRAILAAIRRSVRKELDLQEA